MTLSIVLKLPNVNLYNEMYQLTSFIEALAIKYDGYFKINLNDD